MMLANRPPAAIETQLQLELSPMISVLAEHVAKCDIRGGAAIHGTLTSLLDAMDDIKKVLRDKLLTAIRQGGKRVTDKGTLLLTVDGWELEARPLKTGLDPKRLEAALRARGADPSRYMQTTLSYKVDNEKLQQAISDGVLSPEEISSCKYEHDQQYAVQPPRKVGHE